MITMFCMQNIVGPRIREARLQHKPQLTQLQLATKLQLDDWNISRSGIGKIEAGLRQVTDIELVKLANTLGVSVAWLIGEQD